MQSPNKSKHTSRKWLKRLGLSLIGLFLLSLIITAVYARVKDTLVMSNPPQEDLFVDVGGRKIHLHVSGQENSGPAVVLIPCSDTLTLLRK